MALYECVGFADNDLVNRNNDLWELHFIDVLVPRARKKEKRVWGEKHNQISNLQSQT